MKTITQENERRTERSYRVPDDVRATHNADGAVLLSVGYGQMFSANRVGSEMFQLLRAGESEAAILAEIGSRFGVSEPVVRADLHEFITTLMKCHLLEVMESESAAGASEPTARCISV